MITPTDVARIHNAGVTRAALAQYRQRRTSARRLGYSGPLTRAELAAMAGR